MTRNNEDDWKTKEASDQISYKPAHVGQNLNRSDEFHHTHSTDES